MSQESIAKLLKEKVTKCPKSVFFTFWDGLVQNCITLSQQISHKTAAFYTDPLLLHNFKVSQGTWFRSHPLNNCGIICNTILHSNSNCPLGIALYSSYRTWTVTTYPYCHIQPSLMVSVVYAVIVILLSACMLMLSYVIIVSCIDAHACIESEWVFLHPKEWLCLWARSICIIA